MTILDVIETMENLDVSRVPERSENRPTTCGTLIPVINEGEDRYKDQRVKSVPDFKERFLSMAREVATQPQVYVVARRVTQ